jgi:hypothetical protein
VTGGAPIERVLNVAYAICVSCTIVYVGYGLINIWYFKKPRGTKLVEEEEASSGDSPTALQIFSSYVLIPVMYVSSTTLSLVIPVTLLANLDARYFQPLDSLSSLQIAEVTLCLISCTVHIFYIGAIYCCRRVMQSPPGSPLSRRV